MSKGASTTSQTAVEGGRQVPDALKGDLEEMRRKVDQFQRRAISEAEFRAFRVPQGIYEQRTSGTFMLRVRLFGGRVTPDQMRVVAEVADAYGDGTLHLTSRQDLQVHGAAVAGLYPALVRLAEAGLSTKGGGGNTVRNIAACYQAGVCPEEIFDVTPHAVRLTEFLLPDPLSYQLPRKFKIACSGCSRDCAGATINDVGFIGKRRDGEEGFTVWAGGGMGAQSRTGRMLEDFIPVDRASAVAEAVKRIFDTHGNRKNKHRARLRFLVDDLGFDEFKKLYREELERMTGRAPACDVAEQPTRQVETPAPGRLAAAPGSQARLSGVGHALGSEPAARGFQYWRQANISRQKQPGHYTVEISAPLGVLRTEQMRRLADVVDRFGERALRATSWQNFVLRSVAESDLPALHADLAAMGLGNGEPPILRHLVSCAGASTCRLGICLSRGLTKAVRETLLESDLHLKNGTGQVRIHVSGCPNACGRHPIADIGLSGMARRVNGRLVPHYTIHLGGHVEEGGTSLARSVCSVPARNVPSFLVAFLRSFERATQHPDFAAFLGADGIAIAEALGREYAHVPEFAADQRYYADWGADEVFSLAGRGPGECGAGVFDLIEVDLAGASEALEAGRLFSATALAARALLVTRGQQADTDQQSLDLFQRHFVEPHVVSADFKPLIERAQHVVAAADPEAAFDAREEDVANLLAAVQVLYGSLGPSLRVAVPGGQNV